MIAHTGLNVSSYRRSKEFYKKTLKPLDYKNNMNLPKWKAAGFNDGKNTDFWIGEKKNPQRSHVAFVHDPDGHNIEAVWFDYKKK